MGSATRTLNITFYTILLGVCFIYPLQAQTVWREASYSDFLDGNPTYVDVITPDPDGTDDGALRLSYNDTIRVLQVYPDGRCTDCMSTAIYNYMRLGTPPLEIKIFLMPISQFNATARTDSSILTVRYINHSGSMGPSEDKPFYFFDIVAFGAADCYGSCDLNSASADAVRMFVHRGNGLMLTHDTVTSACSNHPGFNSLTDITGLSTTPEPHGNLFTSVYRVADDTLSHFHTPFDIPSTFTVASTHWCNQSVVNGTMLYIGDVAPASSYDTRLYWHAYYNPDINSFSSFFSYGHREVVPAEYEAKAMINSMFYAFHGGIGTGVYESSIYEAREWLLITAVNWSETVPEGGEINVSVQIDTALSLGDTSWTNWLDVASSGSAPSLYVTGKRFRYRVGMSKGTGSGDIRPVLHWIELALDEPSEDPWPMFQHDIHNTARSSYQVCEYRPRIKWKYHIAGGVNAREAPSVGGDTAVYVGTNDGKLKVINSDDGSLKWEVSTSRGQAVMTPGLSPDGKVVISSNDSYAYCYSRDTHSLLWSYHLASRSQAGPAIDRDRGFAYVNAFYDGSWHAHFYKFNLLGSLIWDGVVSGSGTWSRSSPSVDVDEGLLFLTDYANPRGRMVALDDTTGSVVWAVATPSTGSENDMVTSVVLDTSLSRAYATDNPNSANSRVFSVTYNHSTGSLDWTHSTGSRNAWQTGGLLPGGDFVVTAQDNKLYRFTPTGSLVWSESVQSPSNVAIDSTGVILVGSGDGNLYAYSSTGDLVWNLPLSGNVYSPVIGKDGDIFVTTSEDTLYCLKCLPSLQIVLDTDSLICQPDGTFAPNPIMVNATITKNVKPVPSLLFASPPLQTCA